MGRNLFIHRITITCLGFLLFCLAACASKQTEFPPAGQESEAWEKMLQISSEPVQPCRIQFSLRFGQENDTRRVTGVLWSNDTETIRLDANAGVGVTVAKIMDTPQSFRMVVPQQNKIYEHEGTNRPLLRIGAPLPFDLSQLAKLLTGHYSQVFGNSFTTVKSMDDNGVSYELQQPVVGTLEISPKGLPVLWKTPNWSLRFKYDEDDLAPSSLRLTGTGGKLAVFLVKSREYPNELFKMEQMRLDVPAGSQRLPIANYKP